MTITGIGHDEELIFNFIQKTDLSSVVPLVEEVFTLFPDILTTGLSLTTLIEVAVGVASGLVSGITNIPVTGASSASHIVSLVVALYNGGMFAVQGAGPHGDYAKYLPAMSNWVLDTANASGSGSCICLAVNGTGSPNPWDWGFSSDLLNSVVNPMQVAAQQCWGSKAFTVMSGQVIGYPAATINMGASVITGVANLTTAFLSTPTDVPKQLFGYSQGSLVIDTFWRQCLTRGSPTYERQGEIIGMVPFGDPMRTPGIHRGNDYAGFATDLLEGQITGGIAGDGDLTVDETPPFLMSCNNADSANHWFDLYGAAPVGASPWATAA